jgi:hypothetical protein
VDGGGVVEGASDPAGALAGAGSLDWLAPGSVDVAGDGDT